jgi:hypothetical protein
LLGSTVRTLVDYPILTTEMIQEAINHHPFLRDSTLLEQVERVTFVPSFMSTEDLSKVWSVLFQTPYVLSFAYQGGAVLIEGERAGSQALPVQSRQFFTTPNQPKIDRVTTIEGSNRPVTLESTLVILGRNFSRDRNPVRLGKIMLNPEYVNEKQLVLNLANLSELERSQIRAGVQNLQVVQLADPRSGQTERFQFFSNAVAIVIQPNVVEEIIEGVLLEPDEEGSFYGNLSIRLDLSVSIEQKVFLFLNQCQAAHPASYVFAANSRDGVTQEVSFPVQGIESGSYLIRVQVDGADSTLQFDAEQDQYVAPVLEIP